MPGCQFQTEVEDGLRVIRVSGVLDPASALELTERLAREQGDDVVLDFSLVREFADLGVATLAHSLAARHSRLRLRGLRQHQVRIFRYFGVDPETLDRARAAR